MPQHGEGTGAHRLPTDRPPRELEWLLDLVCEFAPDTMRTFEEQGGWAGDTTPAGEESSAHLVMYSGYIEEYPPNLKDESVARCLIEAAADLQP